MMKEIVIKLRTDILVSLTHKIVLPLLKIIRKPNMFTYSTEQLMKLPVGSLGNDLFLFLEKRNLPLLQHYAQHDLKHVLLGYDTTDEGEACLQSFMLGNGRRSFPVIATVIYSSATMPEYWKKMRQAFRRGKNSNPIHNLLWKEILQEKTSALQSKMFNQSVL